MRPNGAPAGWPDAPGQALGPAGAQRLAELTGPLLGAAFESGLLPGQSTLGIANVPPPAPAAALTLRSPLPAQDDYVKRVRDVAAGDLPVVLPGRFHFADPGWSQRPRRHTTISPFGAWS
jgi:hypothetical protein